MDLHQMIEIFISLAGIAYSSQSAERCPWVSWCPYARYRHRNQGQTRGHCRERSTYTCPKRHENGDGCECTCTRGR